MHYYTDTYTAAIYRLLFIKSKSTSQYYYYILLLHINVLRVDEPDNFILLCNYSPSGVCPPFLFILLMKDFYDRREAY